MTGNTSARTSLYISSSVCHRLQRSLANGKGSTDPIFGYLAPRGNVAATSKSSLICETIKEWVAQCDQDHSACMHSNEVSYSFRLVHVDGDRIRLVESPPRVRYLTLSYCWGSAVPFTTTLDNIGAMKISIDPLALPQTFRDMMVLARNLGVPYVWIDALCIIQDDSQDWQEQSTRMAAIYANAYVNISAALAPDCERGIFSHRQRSDNSELRTYGAPPRDFGGLWVALCDAKVGKSKRVHKIFMREALDHSEFTTISANLIEDNVPLLKRAWAMQERLLSRRTVHFGSSELIWECRTCARCECGRLDLFGPKADLQANEQNFKTAFASIIGLQPVGSEGTILKTWLRMVEIYSSRLLTFEKDRLTALSSIARSLKNTDLGVYLGGVWSYELIQGLAWVSADPEAHRPSYYRAPSWAWSSIEGAVSYTSERHLPSFKSRLHRPGLSMPLSTTKATVKDVAFTLATINSFGDLRSAEVTISAPVVPAVLMRNEKIDEAFWTDDSSLVIGCKGLKLGFHPDVQSDYDRLGVGEFLPCVTLLLGTVEDSDADDHAFRALVLEPDSEQPSRLRRIGTLKGSKYEYPSYADTKPGAQHRTWKDWCQRMIRTFEAWFDVEHMEVRII